MNEPDLDDYIRMISCATDNNSHTLARKTLANYMKEEKLVHAYNALLDLERKETNNRELLTIRDALDVQLFTKLETLDAYTVKRIRRGF